MVSIENALSPACFVQHQTINCLIKNNTHIKFTQLLSGCTLIQILQYNVSINFFHSCGGGAFNEAKQTNARMGIKLDSKNAKQL